ncbi:MAG: DUF1501 domain-containing protein [Deltaproteobacteria bacterium]|nr:DUF1501 domain-containing protein [Deltaproteobacteria bacterium]
MLSRRSALQLGAASWLLAGAPRVFAKQPTGVPRYFLTVYCRGGIDSVYTMDPKKRADVDADIDVPYGPEEIVDAGPYQLGPHLKGLKQWASKMAIVRGVRVQTANHETGSFQMLRMRAGVTASMPALFDVLGQHRDGQPLSTVSLGNLASFEHTPGALEAPTGESDRTSLNAVDDLSDEDVALLAASYKKHLARMPSSSSLSAEGLRTREHVQQVQAFFDRLQHIPRFKPTSGGRSAEDLQRALWFLEHDLSRSVFVKFQYDWDSHYRNAEKQAGANSALVSLVDKLLKDLESRKNEHGTLASQTVLLIGSELGRFPVINGNLGKDHFPESAYMMFGPSVNVGKSFVPTGKRMQGLKVSAKTGQPADVDADHVIIDDIGATMLHMARVKPELYGYTGRRLSFLERA